MYHSFLPNIEWISSVHECEFMVLAYVTVNSSLWFKLFPDQSLLLFSIFMEDFVSHDKAYTK